MAAHGAGRTRSASCDERTWVLARTSASGLQRVVPGSRIGHWLSEAPSREDALFAGMSLGKVFWFKKAAKIVSIQRADTRHTTFPRSSAIRSAPALSTARPTGRPSALPSGAIKPVTMSRAFPLGLDPANGTHTTL